MDVEIKFEPDGRSGIVATGTYLLDAARRLGVDLGDNRNGGEDHSPKVTILSGKNLLSEPTKLELDTLDAEQIIKGVRLASQAKIIAEGEIVVMVEEKKQTAEEKTKEEEKKKVDEFRKEFDALPLEKKVAALLELEAVTLSETLAFVVNSPYAIFGKVMDVLAEFGLKMDREDQKNKRPTEHQEETAGAKENGSSKKEKKSQKKTAAAASEPEPAAENKATPEENKE